MNNANTPTDHTTNEDSTTEDTREIHPAVITWALVIGLVVAFVVTASSFKLSFTTLLDLGSMAGMRDSAWVIPVVLDGPILAASIFRIALSQHTDRKTVRGRRLIIAVFALAGLASMAGNAYHAVLTVTDLNAAVAAALGALAPLMVMTMSEMMAIAISAPRRHRPTTATTSGTTSSSGSGSVVESAAPAPGADVTTVPGDTAAAHVSVIDDSASVAEVTGVEEDLDNGLLRPAVWTSVEAYLAHPDWSYSDIARHLDIHTSTVSRHNKTWTQVQHKIASDRSIDPVPPGLEERSADPGTDRTIGVDANTRYDDTYHPHDSADHDYVGADHDYVGADHAYVGLSR